MMAVVAMMPKSDRERWQKYFRRECPCCDGSDSLHLGDGGRIECMDCGVSFDSWDVLYAINLRQDGHISLGKVGELMGWSVYETMEFFGSLGIPVMNYTPEDFLDELEMLGLMKGDGDGDFG